MSRLVALVTVKQPSAGAEHSVRVTGVPAANSAAVPISIAVAPPRFVPVTVVLDDWMMAGVMLPDVTTPFTVIEPLVNVPAVLVHEICCPIGEPHTHPVPSALTGTTPAGSVSVTVTGTVSAAPDELAVTTYVTGLPGASVAAA